MTIKEQTKALWKRCFNDSDDFTDLYFRLRYSEEVNQTLKEGNEVIAALQMLPYPMTFCGRTVPTSYISGACTHPDHRNRGAMRTLLAHSFERMRQEGILFSTLIPAEPWLFNYYVALSTSQQLIAKRRLLRLQKSAYDRLRNMIKTYMII